MFSRIGLPEILVVLVILLLLFGGKKVPELARGLGEALKEFRSATENGGKKGKKK